MNLHETTRPGGVGCPKCEGTMRTEPNQPKAVCDSCDATIMPCPECGHLVLVPGEENADRGYCPDCGSNGVQPRPNDEGFVCLDCRTSIPTEEFPGDTLTCGTCKETVGILRDDPVDID